MGHENTERNIHGNWYVVLMVTLVRVALIGWSVYRYATLVTPNQPLCTIDSLIVKSSMSEIKCVDSPESS